jgi:dipeptidyl aminopeptidase/acylaminoacyl peptidase
LAGTEDGVGPFWSPDSRSIGFFEGGQLKRIDLDTGAVQSIASAPAHISGAWGHSGSILFTPVENGPLYSVAANGGVPVPATRLQPPQTAHWGPRFLPDHRHFLFLAWGPPEAKGIYLGSLDTMDVRRVLDANLAPAEFLPPNYVVFERQGALMAQPWNFEKLQPVGDAIPMAPHVAGTSYAGFSTALSGSVAYRGEGERSQLLWLDRSGQQVGTLGAPDDAPRSFLRASPDRRTVALIRRVGTNSNVWFMDDAGGLRRFTFDARGNHLGIVWAPDGRHLVSNWDPNGILDLYDQPLIGAANDTPLFKSPEHKFPMDWSPDGHVLLYTSRDPKTGRDLWALPLSGDRHPVPVAHTQFQEDIARFSPDGRWVAYQSDETGQYEIYIQPFPGPGLRSKISSGGGIWPEWRADGRELFYVASDDRLMAVPLSVSSQGVPVAKPASLFTMPKTLKTAAVLLGSQYVAAPDGQRFLVNAMAEAPPITMLLNWKPPQKE